MLTMDGAGWTVSDMRAWLLAHRRRRRTGWIDWYYRTVAVIIVGSMVASLAGGFSFQPLGCAPVSAGCVVALTLLPLTWTVALTVLVGAGAALLGPLAVGPATAAWVLALPLDRAETLSPDLGRLILVGTVVGATSGVVLWLLSAGSPVWIAACAAGGALAVVSAVLAQQGGGGTSLARAGVAVSAAWGLFGAVMLTQTASPTLIASAVTAILASSAWWLGRRARAGLGSMSRFDLARHGRWRSGLAGAASAADAGLVLDLLTHRLAAGRRSRPLGTPAGRGATALAGYEIRRLLLGWVAAMILAAAAPLSPSAMLAASCVVMVPALGLMASSLRMVVRAPGLARAIGLSPFAQRAALVSGAALAAAAWIAWATVPMLASGQPPLATVLLAWATGAAGLAGALRWVSAPTPVFTTGLIMTDLGPVPVGALRSALTGFDVAIPVAALVVAGVSPVMCAAAASIALLWTLVSPVQTQR